MCLLANNNQEAERQGAGELLRESSTCCPLPVGIVHGCQQELSGVVDRVPLVAHCSSVPLLMPTHTLSYHYPLPSHVICTALHVLGRAGVPLHECVICASICISIVLVWPSVMRLVRLVVPELLLMTGL